MINSDDPESNPEGRQPEAERRDDLRASEDVAFPEPFRKLMRTVFGPLNRLRRR